MLEIPGCKSGNKRIANVISVGYSDCFSLSKNDLWMLLNDYPVVSGFIVYNLMHSYTLHVDIYEYIVHRNKWTCV